MWDGLFMLLGLSTVMAAASFLAGALPLSFVLSPRQLRLITAVGTGVLVGTSLIVIIPEGVETLYAARAVSHTHIPRADTASLLGAPAAVAYGRAVFPGAETVHVVRQEAQFTGPDDGRPDDEPPIAPAGERLGFADKTTSPIPGHDEKEWEPHAWVGVSLILGFILMYLIDRVPRHLLGSSAPKPSHIALNTFTLRRTGAQNEESEGQGAETTPEGDFHSRPSSTTVGLVIHAAADGIALGASSAGSSTRFGFIIFLALMIHKAPAAFGLTSALLKQGLSKRRARTHLAIFSAAAPIGALITFSLANMFGSGRLGNEDGTQFATGVLLLFSGGTFLYVAMHTMQDSGHSHDGTDSPQNGFAGNPYGRYQAPPAKAQSTTLTESLATVAGMLLPLLTQAGHAH